MGQEMNEPGLGEIGQVFKTL